MTGGDVISTDDLTTLNSVAVTGQKVQRMKTGFGADGVQTDVTSTTPLPVTDTGTDTINQQFIDNQPIKTTADGVQLNSLADEFGDPLNTTNKALHVKIDNAIPVPVTSGLPTEVTAMGRMGGLSAGVVVDARGAANVFCSFSIPQAITATLVFEGLLDGASSWVNVPYSIIDSTGSAGTTTSVGTTPAVNTQYIVPTMGYSQIRVRFSAYTSGVVNAFLKASNMSVHQRSYMSLGLDGSAVLATGSNAPVVSSIGQVVDIAGTVPNRVRQMANATNTTGTGIQAVGMLAQLDDTTPTAITENQFGNVRMTSRRSQLVQREDINSLTYSCSSGAIVPALTATDIFTITGNATTTVFVTKVTVGGTQTTGGMTLVKLIKRSTANSAGTSTAGVNVPHDSADAAASATTLVYTANPTTGTAVGTIRSQSVAFSSATGTTNNVLTFELGDKGRPVVLRGTAQVLAVNLNGVTVTGGSLNIDIEWYEV